MTYLCRESTVGGAGEGVALNRKRKREKKREREKIISLAVRDIQCYSASLVIRVTPLSNPISPACTSTLILNTSLLPSTTCPHQPATPLEGPRPPPYPTPHPLMIFAPLDRNKIGILHSVLPQSGRSRGNAGRFTSARVVIDGRVVVGVGLGRGTSK